jgi:hypothetical protein
MELLIGAVPMHFKKQQLSNGFVSLEGTEHKATLLYIH